MEGVVYHNTLRRLRRNRMVRELSADVVLTHKKFIQPLFIYEEKVDENTVEYADLKPETLSSILYRIEKDLQSGIDKFLLFPVPARKDDFSFSFSLQAVQQIKNRFANDLWLAADVCLCSITSHGHCGLLNEQKDEIDNHASVQLLSDYALQLAQAGADCVSPSDMMDGRVAAIRRKLNEQKRDEVAIMSYSAKFASHFYGPFRDICKSYPANGQLTDRRTYQIPVANSNDAIESALRDYHEEADILIVKPACYSTDIIYRLSRKLNKPVAAYQVSGEVAAIELLHRQHQDEKRAAYLETWFSLARSGAQIIITYAARHAKEWIESFKY
ncbi:MAG: porphobilinogen synthase [Chitinophagaceae bacterium]|nr:porphobilinogen synthase [Chitinophagaceae bacterium]